MQLPDWLSPHPYDFTAQDRTALAWEFLSRNPDYRAAHAAVRPGRLSDDVAPGWGLRFLD